MRAMGEAARKTNDEITLDRCAQQTALALRVSAESVRTEFGKLKIRVRGNMSEPAPEPMMQPDTHEFWLLCLLFAEDSGANWLADHLELEWIGNAGVREIVSRRLAVEAGGAWAGAAMLVSELDTPTSALLTEALADKRPVDNPARQLTELVQRLRDRHIDRKLSHLTQQLARPDLSMDDQSRLMNERRDWLRRKAEPITV